MTSLIQLESYASELASAVKSLSNYFQDTNVRHPSQLLVPPEAPSEVHQARRTVLANIAKLQTLLSEPADFLQHLACQNQLLACLQWLGEFQVLACIPLSGSVPTKDVADLSGVPETQLCRIVRMTATAGFLNEPQPGHVAHTALSAPFVVKRSFLDAVMFLAESAAPTALQMAVATQRYGHSTRPNESAYNLAFNTLQSFQSVCEQRLKLQRQWSAYHRYAGDVDDSAIEVLKRLDWLSLGKACIVEVGAQSSGTATVLAELYPALHFIVQIAEPGPSNGAAIRQQSATNRVPPLSTSIFSSRALKPGATKTKELQFPEPSSNITVHKRVAGTLQTVDDAAVYIIYLPSPSPGVPFYSLTAQIVAELRAHLNVLRASNYATLVLIARLLPEPGTVDPDIEAVARLRDLSLLQLANEREMEMAELVDMINGVRDSKGWLVVINKLRSHNNAVMALGVKYQAYANDHQKLQLAPTII